MHRVPRGLRCRPLLGPPAERLRPRGEADRTRGGEAVRQEGQEERRCRRRGPVRGRGTARDEVRADQERGAAGRAGPARGQVAAGEATDHGGERPARLGRRVRGHRAQGSAQARGTRGLVSAEEGIPAAGRQAMAELYAHGRAVAERVATLEEQIVRHARQDATARRLATIPGIGPITASLIAATVGDHIGAFRSARHFAAWLGLVPRQHSTGGGTRSGGITKAGNAEIRRLLVLGATSMVWRATLWDSKAGLWVRGVLARRPVRLVTVALANKLARIAWALMTRGEVYQAQGRAPAAAATVA